MAATKAATLFIGNLMIDKKLLPEHVAVIMDGNGRWAQRNKVNRVAGHNAGMLAMKEIIKRSDVIGIKYLTVYAFSTENWKRSSEEVGGIFGLLVKYVASELEELNKKNVKVSILGDYSQIPKSAVNSINKALKTTQNNDGLHFCIALNYGSRQEIVRSVKKIGELIQAGQSTEAEVTEDTIAKYLYTGEENGYIPDPDLVIRTSGEERLSNFLLWQSAYSEFAFSDSLWPDFTPDEFENMIEKYTKRERRFGGR